MSQDSYSRRRLVAATGTAALGFLAGCSTTDSSGNGENNDSGGYEDSDSEPEYGLEFSIDDGVDLSGLPTSELGSFDRVRGEEDGWQDYAGFEYQLLEDGEEVDADQVNLILEGEDGEENTVGLGSDSNVIETDDGYQLPCYKLLEGENTVTAKAEVDGETVAEASGTTQKKTPETYRAEVQIDGENLTNYTTPYRFDVVNVDTEEYQKLRQEFINQKTWNDKVVQPTLENDRHNFHPVLDSYNLQYSHGENEWITENFQNHGTNDLGKIIQDAGTAWMKKYAKDVGGPPSGDMINNAATTMTLVDRHINGIPEGENRYEHEREVDLEGGHFSTVGHGQALFYERNTQQWLNFDPQGVVVSKPSEAPMIDEEERFYAPIEYMIGKPENHNGVYGYDRKKEEGIRALNIMHRINDGIAHRTDMDDHWIHNNVKKIGRNEPLGQETENMLKAMNWTDHQTERKTKPIIYGGDQNENRLLITENEQHWKTFKEKPEPVTTEEVQTEMLT